MLQKLSEEICKLKSELITSGNYREKIVEYYKERQRLQNDKEYYKEKYLKLEGSLANQILYLKNNLQSAENKLEEKCGYVEKYTNLVITIINSFIKNGHTLEEPLINAKDLLQKMKQSLCKGKSIKEYVDADIQTENEGIQLEGDNRLEIMKATVNIMKERMTELESIYEADLKNIKDEMIEKESKYILKIEELTTKLKYTNQEAIKLKDKMDKLEKGKLMICNEKTVTTFDQPQYSIITSTEQIFDETNEENDSVLLTKSQDNSVGSHDDKTMKDFKLNGEEDNVF